MKHADKTKAFILCLYYNKSKNIFNSNNIEVFLFVYPS